MHIRPGDWTDILRTEYLRDFVRNGGAAVKFAIPLDDDGATDLHNKLRVVAREEGFLLAAVSAEHTKTHMIDHLFHEVARQVDWDSLAFAFVSRILADNGYQLPSERAQFSLRVIAELNERAEPLLRKDLQTWLERAIFRDYRMTQEFRIAMIRLCRAQLDSEEADAFLTNAVKEWLRGELRLISAVKDALIFQKIARHNARHMFFSLSHWLKICGSSGLVIVLDVARYTLTRRTGAAEHGIFYSTPAVMDGYEVLRQFIDGTDDLECCLMVVISSRELLTDARRGLLGYDALRLRITDEVHDRRRLNPLASLVRLSANSAMGTSEVVPDESASEATG